MADFDVPLTEHVFDVPLRCGNRMYIITARRMISGFFLKQRKRERMVMPNATQPSARAQVWLL